MNTLLAEKQNQPFKSPLEVLTEVALRDSPIESNVNPVAVNHFPALTNLISKITSSPNVPTTAPQNIPAFFPVIEDLQNMKKRKNREAARKCRQKKLEKIKILEDENKELKEKYENSRRKNKTYENIIKSMLENLNKKFESKKGNFFGFLDFWYC